MDKIEREKAAAASRTVFLSYIWLQMYELMAEQRGQDTPEFANLSVAYVHRPILTLPDAP